MKKMVLFLAFAILFGGLFAMLSFTNYTVSPSSVKEGGSGVLALTISNPVASSGTSEKLYAVALSFYPPSVISMTDKITVGDIDIGVSNIVSVPFYVKSDVKSGIYVVEIRASSSGGSTIQTATIPISIVDSPILSLSFDKDVVGEIEPIKLTITNNGGAANRVRISINSSGFAFIGKDSEFVETIGKISIVNITLDSRSANDGANDVYFNIKYQDELGNELIEKKGVRLTVKKEKLDADLIQKSEIITRKDSVLKLEIKNSGKFLGDMRISFGTDSIKFKEASEFKVGDLEGGAKIEVSMPVYTTLAPGTNYVNFDIKYTDKGVEKEKTVSVPLTVTSDADVAVYLDVKPAPLSVGQEHTISVLVSNLGSYEISNVDVAISSPALETLDLQEKEYIGGLDKDDFSTVQFKVKTKDLAPGTYPLNVAVNYRDKSGEWKTKTLPNNIILYAASAKGNGGLFYILALVAIVAAAVWYFKFKKPAIRSPFASSERQ